MAPLSTRHVFRFRRCRCRRLLQLRAIRGARFFFVRCQRVTRSEVVFRLFDAGADAAAADAAAMPPSPRR